MAIALWVLIGVLVGSLASFLMKARGFRILIFLGVSILGAVLGGLDVAYLYRTPGALNEWSLTALLVAFAGALIAIAIVKLLMPRKSPAA